MSGWARRQADERQGVREKHRDREETRREERLHVVCVICVTDDCVLSLTQFNSVTLESPQVIVIAQLVPPPTHLCTTM